MRAVVGLGNPGEEYARTRHNAGFLVLAELAYRWRVDFGKLRRGSRVARARFGSESVILVEPLTYMNCSGEALARLDADIRPDAGAMIVVHDDLDLSCGRVAIKVGGGTGGHRGLVSIAAWAGPEFVRVRLGIGRPPIGDDAAAFVLRPFRNEELPLIREAVCRAADAVEAILEKGAERAMSVFNVRRGAEAQTAERSEETR